MVSKMVTSYGSLSTARKTKALFTAVGIIDDQTTGFCKGTFPAIAPPAGWTSAWGISQRDVVVMYKGCDGTWQTYCKFSMNQYSAHLTSQVGEAFGKAEACAAPATPTSAPTLAPTMAYTLDWNAGFADTNARAATYKAGTKLTFSWTGGSNSHNVVLMTGKAAFDSCDFTGGTNLGASSPVTYTISREATQPLYFACSVGSHCNSGQKLAVTVEAAPTAAPTQKSNPVAATYTAGTVRVSPTATFSTLVFVLGILVSMRLELFR